MSAGRFELLIYLIREEDRTRDINFTIQIGNLCNYIQYILIDGRELVKKLQYFKVVCKLYRQLK